MIKKRFIAGMVAGAAVLAVAACGEQVAAQIEPKLELRTAAQHLGAAKQAGFTVKLSGSADELIAGLKLQATSEKSDFTDEDADVLRKVANSTLTIGYDKAGDGTEDDRSMVGATIDGVAGTEIRFVDGMIYAKAPVADLAQKFGAGGDIDDLRKEATSGMPELGSFFDGGWVAVDAKQATELGASSALGTSGAADTADAQKMLAELQTSATNLVEGAEVTRDSADEHHLVVTSSTTKAYTEAKRLAAAMSKELGSDLSEEVEDAPKDRPIVVDLWVEDGTFTAAEVNILQFIDGATGRAAVRVEVTTGSEIAVPDNAAKIDLSALTQQS
ncbi:hypothetical protein [Actinoplanes sp. NPDC051494]|uniref:hypothetical protein n=1 Tax=Actinoplanes sp. NPDC051494 TaxID=3363907 RepID=UPI003799847D